MDEVQHQPHFVNGRTSKHDRECHLDVYGEIAVGDAFPVIRGNGPREGDHIGTGIVTGLDENGTPALEIWFDDQTVDPRKLGGN
jgi:hypothetical protein